MGAQDSLYSRRMVHLVRSLPLAALLLASCASQLGGCSDKVPQPSEDEVSALISAFETSGLSLERNGEVMDNAKAAKWFRTKWARRAANIRTGEDFIKSVADHSTETKKPYLIILANGKKEPSNAWFTARLKELRR